MRRDERVPPVFRLQPRNQLDSSPPGTPEETRRASPPLKSALQQQLGLRLDEVKGPLDVLVIELVEQPTPN
jgi:uncharacterized protein (TIGR03435 family)